MKPKYSRLSTGGVAVLRLVLVLSLIGSPVMAAPRTPQAPGLLDQRVSPEGQTLGPDDMMSDAEMFMMMWRQNAGDKPLPADLRKKYKIPDSFNPEPKAKR